LVVEGPVARGFYAATYRAIDNMSGGVRAVKVTPMAVFDEVLGYGRDMTSEPRALNALKDRPWLAPYIVQNAPIDVTFGDDPADTVACCAMQVDFIEGLTLDRWISTESATVRRLGQVFWDLLEVIADLEAAGQHHNDLHGSNMIVQSLDDANQRVAPIDSYLRLRVLDFGSADSDSKSLSGIDGRLGDLEWVAQHMITRVDQLMERLGPDFSLSERRFAARLRQLGEYYSGAHADRLPTPGDLQQAIVSAWRDVSVPVDSTTELQEVGDHFNALTLDWSLIPQLFVTSGESRFLDSAGTVLITGMRGCGKTMLLKMLAWNYGYGERSSSQALTSSDGEATQPLGLFVSCSALVRQTRERRDDAPMHRLILALAREAIRCVGWEWTQNPDSVRVDSFENIVRVLSRITPWFASPRNVRDVFALEASVEDALHATPPQPVPGISTQEAFESLTAAIRSLVDGWSHRLVLYLIDDVSSRYLHDEEIEVLLSGLVLNHPTFGIKLTTENQLLEMKTLAGEPAQESRDMRRFDLGLEVLNMLNSDDAQFLSEVLSRRHEQARWPKSAREVVADLGNQPYKNVAKTIFEGDKPKDAFWGATPLAALCTGNLGDVIGIYGAMRSRASAESAVGDRDAPLTRRLQQREISAYANVSLGHMVMHRENGLWLMPHVDALGAASHKALKETTTERLAKSGRYREYTRLSVRLKERDRDVLKQLYDLVDAGVLVLRGASKPRVKGSDPYTQYKFDFRTLLGVQAWSPVGRADRWELDPEQAREWLARPTLLAELTPRRDGASNKIGAGAEAEKLDTVAADPVKGVTLPRGEQTVADPQMDLFQVDRAPEPADGATDEAGLEPRYTRLVDMPPTRWDVVSTPVPLAAEALPWDDALLIVANGFEDRAIASVDLLGSALGEGSVASSLTLSYPLPGHRAEIAHVLGRISQETNEMESQLLAVQDYVGHAPQGEIVLDVSGMTKELIFGLVNTALRQRERCWILHTCAADYPPPDSELEPVATLLEAGDVAQGLDRLNALVAGVRGPFAPIPVVDPQRDTSRESFLAAFVTLKQERLRDTLAAMDAATRVAAIPSRDLVGGSSPRSRVLAALATITASPGLSIEPVSTVDPNESFRLLQRLHETFAVNGPYDFEVALTGTKMQVVGAGMFAAVNQPAGVYYPRPLRPAGGGYDPAQFTRGSMLPTLHLAQRTFVPAERSGKT
jgi:hypothetical protein